MRGGAGVHTFRVQGLGSMFSRQPEVGLAPSIADAQRGIAHSAPMEAARMVAFAPQQFTAPLDPSSTDHVFGVRTDGSVGSVPVRHTPALVSNYGAGVDHRAPLAQQVSAASEGAQFPQATYLVAPDQVRGFRGFGDVTAPADHPASTTGSHWLGGLAVAGVLALVAVGGVALYRAVS